MSNLTIGLLGFGEVGHTFAGALKGKCRVLAYDSGLGDDRRGKLIRERAASTGALLSPGAAELARSSDIIFGVIPTTASVTAARTLAPGLSSGKVYCDLSSSPPSVKREVEAEVAPTGATFLDGSILGSMALYGARAPVVLSGRDSSAWAERLIDLGLRVTAAGDAVGAASSTKLLRSVFTKGYEALLLETFHTASLLGVEDLILEILADTFDRESFAQSVSRYLTSDAIHAARRADEMEGVVSLLEELGVEPVMACAARRRLQWSAALGLKDYFQENTPDSFREVLEVIRRKVEEKV